MFKVMVVLYCALPEAYYCSEDEYLLVVLHSWQLVARVKVSGWRQTVLSM